MAARAPFPGLEVSWMSWSPKIRKHLIESNSRQDEHVEDKAVTAEAWVTKIPPSSLQGAELREVLIRLGAN